MTASKRRAIALDTLHSSSMASTEPVMAEIPSTELRQRRAGPKQTEPGTEQTFETEIKHGDEEEVVWGKTAAGDGE